MRFFVGKKSKLYTWKKFSHEVRRKGCNLLSCLDEFPNSILISGCQRSGTTMLTRAINRSNHLVDYWVSKDDELDAALILCGLTSPPKIGRYCFQTTYLNECYMEYYKHINSGLKIIWMLRNPYSVVYSMLHNWHRFALNELFNGCGSIMMSTKEHALYEKYGLWTVKRVKRACLSYNAKTQQALELYRHLGPKVFKILIYDDIVDKPSEGLREVFSFIDLEFEPSITDSIHSKSKKKHMQLPYKEINLVKNLCEPIYMKVKSLTCR